jgi:hypothetical protein
VVSTLPRYSGFMMVDYTSAGGMSRDFVHSP